MYMESHLPKITPVDATMADYLQALRAFLLASAQERTGTH
jgi:hypothetical protein